MIAAEELDSRDESNEALADLKDFQKEDFKGIFRCVSIYVQMCTAMLTPLDPG
jgi:hypothetical protein